MNGKLPILSCTLWWGLIGAVGAAPAFAQTVTWSELEGVTVEAEHTRDQVIRRQRQFKVQVKDVMKVVIETDKTIDYSVNTTVRGPRGTRELRPLGGLFTLDQPRDVGSRGGGKALWTFADGTLIFVRTFLSGALRTTFAFERGAEGLTCETKFAFAREDGSGEIRMIAPDGEKQTIVSAEQISSRCTIRRKS
jgi:hypothetical protein